jgi:hypothetical protein
MTHPLYGKTGQVKSIPELIDWVPVETKRQGDQVTGKLSDEEWELASEHASYLTACVDGGLHTDSYMREMFMKAAVTGLAFAKTAELLYEESDWSWAGDFRENPRVNPADSSNALDPDHPERTLTTFRVGEHKLKVTLFDDADLYLCEASLLSVAHTEWVDADAHLTGTMDDGMRFFTFYGVRTREMARKKLSRGLEDMESVDRIEHKMQHGKPLKNQLPIAQLE